MASLAGVDRGKTTFLKALKKAFGPDEICFISQDDYYYPREHQETDGQGITNFDRPKSIDKKAFREDIQCLMRGETVTRQEYTFNNDLKVPTTLTFRPAPIIVVEGLFVLHFKKIRKLLDLRVFLHAKDNIKVIRRIRRDQVERNYPIEDVLYRYEHHVLPTFERYIKPYIDECDLVINNNRHFHMGLQVLGSLFTFLARQSPASFADHSDRHADREFRADTRGSARSNPLPGLRLPICPDPD